MSFERKAFSEDSPRSDWTMALSVGNCLDFSFIDDGGHSPEGCTTPRQVVLGCVTKPSTSLRGSLKANKAASGVPPGPFLELLPGCPSVIDYDLEGYAKISHFLSGVAFGQSVLSRQQTPNETAHLPWFYRRKND